MTPRDFAKICLSVSLDRTNDHTGGQGEIMLCGTRGVKLATALVCPIHNHGQTADVSAVSDEFMAQNSAFNEHKDELDHYEQMFGRDRGRLAVSLDRLTNALVLVGQHGVYCTSQRNPTVPAMDLRIVVQELTHAKELVQSVMEELKKARGENGRAKDS
jgi:hypothetical protein